MLRAKKSYGQHFLTSEQIAERIVDSLQETDQYDRVLEVGPGKGVLTKFLLEKPYELIAVEADGDMITYLQQFFPALDGKVVAADFIKLKLDEAMGTAPFGLIGNFPYNISSQILIKMIEYRAQIPEMVGMFQREVAARVISPPGSKVYGVISVLVQAFYTGEYLFTVKPGSFSPPPKVQSAVIRLTRKKDYSLGCDERLFRQIVKQTFNQRRKMLRNTLKSMLPEEVLKEEFFRKRPEVLSVEDFVQLTQRIEKIKGETFKQPKEVIMTFEERINQDLKTAMKAKDKQALRGIRAIKQAILLAKTDGSHAEITEEMAIKMLQKLAKQRKDSLSIFVEQGRDDLAQVEQEELDILDRYLPKAMSPDELETAVKEIIEKVGATSMRDMGKVMGTASKEFAGRADGSTISALVKKLLG